jgi:uncharacterized membrane protein
MTGHGYKLVDGRVFHYARYIDWLVTTPLLLLDLGALAGISTEDSLMLVALDVLMVLCGFAGGLSKGNSSLVMWILGCAFFLPIVFDLAVTFRAKAKVVGAAASACYDKLVVLTVLLLPGLPRRLHSWRVCRDYIDHDRNWFIHGFRCVSEVRLWICAVDEPQSARAGHPPWTHQ